MNCGVSAILTRFHSTRTPVATRRFAPFPAHIAPSFMENGNAEF
jgi:hypothetical protein